MIIFKETKTVGSQKFIVFENENGSTVEVPMSKDQISMILHHFERISPSSALVEVPEGQ
jgi:hypothetical protein